MNKTLLKSQPMKKIKKILAKIRPFGQSLRKHWKRSLLVALGILIAFFVYKRVTAQPAGITSTQVTRGTLTAGFTANGKITAEKSADLKFYSPGKVAWISVKDGDKVGRGRGVAGLDAVQLNSAYQIALNNLRNYQANAEMVVDSVKDHSADETFAQKADRTAAEVMRDNSYDTILATRDALNNSMIIAPFAGTITDTNGIIAGINLTGADLESKFIRIVDLGSLYFAADVDEVDYSKVQVGQPVNVSIDAFPGQECEGKVRKVGKNGEETSGGVVTIPVEVDLVNCNLDFATNLNGQAEFATTKIESVIIAPKKYLVNKNGENFVWKQIGDSIKNRKLVPVKVGATSSTEVEITDGLTEGDTIVFIP